MAMIKMRKKYLKKNTESNICNQAFSFIVSKKKSQQLLLKILGVANPGSEEISRLYYAYARVLKLKRPKYLNKKVLAKIVVDPTIPLLHEISGSTIYSQKLPIPSLCRLMRILLHHFLGHICSSTVLTSRKLSKHTYVEHFQRRRQIS